MILKKYTWVFPLLGGILTLIGIFTPIASFFNYVQIWTWGLVISRWYEISVEFINEPIILNIGIISSIILLIFSTILIITGYLYMRGYFDNYKISKVWISSGIINLTAIIIPLVALDFYSYDYYIPSIWLICDPGFGAIGPIIGSVVSIGIGVMVLSSRAGRKQTPTPISVAAPKNVCPHCGKPVSLNATFCSKCGESINKNPL
jgi:hypothetical protein